MEIPLSNISKHSWRPMHMSCLLFSLSSWCVFFHSACGFFFIPACRVDGSTRRCRRLYREARTKFPSSATGRALAWPIPASRPPSRRISNRTPPRHPLTGSPPELSCHTATGEPRNMRQSWRWRMARCRSLKRCVRETLLHRG